MVGCNSGRATPFLRRHRPSAIPNHQPRRNATYHSREAVQTTEASSPTASLYNNRTQLHAAIEFACLDIIGQKLGVPVYDLLGGKLRDEVPFASYLFFRY